MEKLSTSSEILDKLISELKIDIATLARECGYKRAQAFYDVKDNTTKVISSKMANKIVDAYPNVRLEFLYTGEGDVFKTVNESDCQYDNFNEKYLKLHEKYSLALEEVILLKNELSETKELNAALMNERDILLSERNELRKNIKVAAKTA